MSCSSLLGSQGLAIEQQLGGIHRAQGHFSNIDKGYIRPSLPADPVSPWNEEVKGHNLTIGFICPNNKNETNISNLFKKSLDLV